MFRAAVGLQTDVAAAVRGAIQRHELLRHEDRVVVGFSGGPDSLALLHVLHGLQDELGIDLRAAHLNHGLRGSDADADAEFARCTCLSWGMPLTLEQQDVAALAREWGLAIEEAARQARYAFLAGVAQEVGASAVAVGHNADDQVETVLMHLLRGSGLAGLRGMVPSLPLASLHIPSLRSGQVRGEGDVLPGLRLIRPLLEVSRSAILRYCQQHGLRPRFDRSNLDTTYFRNRLRHELIPYLETFNPKIREVMWRSASVLSADYDCLRQQRERAWQEVVERADGRRVIFGQSSFQKLHLSLRRALIRQAIAWLRPPFGGLRAGSLRNIGLTHVEQVVQALDENRGAGVKVTLPSGLMLTTGYGRFAVADEELVNPFDGEYPQLPSTNKELPVPVPGEVMLPDGWRLTVEITSQEALPAEALAAEHPWLAYLDSAACPSAGSGQAPVGLVLRGRREGERIQPLGLGGHSKKLNELMINLKIPAAYRERYPLLAGPEHLLWLPWFHVDHRARVTAATERVLVACMRRQAHAEC